MTTWNDIQNVYNKLPEHIEWGITWHSYLDACPICKNLNGYPFSGTDEFPYFLTHPQWGNVWDLMADHSLVHPHLNPRGHCRCDLEIYLMIDGSRLSLTDIAQYREDLKGIRADTVAIHSEFREMEYLLYRVTGVLGRMGLPPEIDAAMSSMQRSVLTARMAESGLAQMETGTLFGIALGVTTLVGAGIAGWSMLRDWTDADIRAAMQHSAANQIRRIEAEKMKIRGPHY